MTLYQIPSVVQDSQNHVNRNVSKKRSHI